MRAPFLVLISLASPTLAESSLRVEGSIRARVESFDGQSRSAGPARDSVLLLRSELRVDYGDGPVRIGGELLDSRVASGRDSLLSTSEVNPIEPSQAWVSVDVAEATAVKAGRFNLNLGSRRLLSRNGYRNTVNSFTGVRIDHRTTGGATATAFWTMPHNRYPDDDPSLLQDDIVLDRERDELRTFGVYLVDQRTTLGTLELFAVGLTEGDAPGYATRNRHLVTLGGRLRAAPKAGRPDYDVEAGWQGGHARDGSMATAVRRTVDAGFAQAIAGYTFDTGWKPRIAASIDYFSGNGRGDRQGRYDTLYGSRSFELGATSLFGPIARANLISSALRLEIVPDDRTRAHVAARTLRLARRTDSFGMTGVRDATGSSGRDAGMQYDARVQHWLVPDRLQLGLWLAWLDKGRFLREAPNAPRNGDTHYGALEAIFQF